MSFFYYLAVERFDDRMGGSASAALVLARERPVADPLILYVRAHMHVLQRVGPALSRPRRAGD
jgi:hypothetical protein